MGATASMCMALAMYWEARSEPVIGQIAVAQVIQRRVDSPRFPDTVCGVVFQGGEKRHKCHFSFWCDGLPDDPLDEVAWTKAKALAKYVIKMKGQLYDFSKGADHYHASYVDPWWAAYGVEVVQIGLHHFYKVPIRRS